MDDEARAIDAQRILGNKLYVEAYETIERNLVNQLALAELTVERAAYLRALLVAGRKHRQYMEQVIATGKMVAMEAERKSLLQRTRDALVQGRL